MIDKIKAEIEGNEVDTELGVRTHNTLVKCRKWAEELEQKIMDRLGNVHRGLLHNVDRARAFNIIKEEFHGGKE